MRTRGENEQRTVRRVSVSVSVWPMRSLEIPVGCSACPISTESMRSAHHRTAHLYRTEHSTTAQHSSDIRLPTRGELQRRFPCRNQKYRPFSSLTTPLCSVKRLCWLTALCWSKFRIPIALNMACAAKQLNIVWLVTLTTRPPRWLTGSRRKSRRCVTFEKNTRQGSKNSSASLCLDVASFCYLPLINSLLTSLSYHQSHWADSAG